MLQKSAGTNSSDRAPWHVRNMYGLGAVAAGIAALIAAFVMQFGGDRALDQLPDMRITVPLLLVAIGTGVTSFVRREPHRYLSVAGMGMAGAAVALGWVIVACAVALASIIVIAIIAKFN